MAALDWLMAQRGGRLTRLIMQHDSSTRGDEGRGGVQASHAVEDAIWEHSRMSDMYHLLLSTYCLLLSTYCLLLSTYCLLMSTYCLLLSTYCLLFTANTTTTDEYNYYWLITT